MKKWLFILLFAASVSGLKAQEGTYQAKDFSYLLGKTPGLSADLLTMHLTLYRGYVKNANALIEMIAKIRQAKDDRSLIYGALERRLAWEMDGMILHELYFENLGASAALRTSDSLYRQIIEDFGSFDAWRQNFIATGMIRGIGWVILYQDPIKGKLYNLWIDNHHINHLAGGIPLLVMDVWEHAYLTEYGLNRAGYLEAFFKNINWNSVRQRWMSAGKSGGKEQQRTSATR
ncbi:MAG: superoxide dismutase [Chlamydiota bacterium]